MRCATASDYPGRAKRFGCAHDGADVAGILHSGDYYDERILAEQIIQSPCGSDSKCGDTLWCVRPGNAAKQAIGSAQDAQTVGQELSQASEMPVAGIGDQQGFDAEVCAESCFDKMRAFEAERGPSVILMPQRALEGVAKTLEPAVVRAVQAFGFRTVRGA